MQETVKGSLEHIDLFEHGPLESIVSDCIRQAINQQGPIQKIHIGTVSKFITSALRARLKQLSTSKKIMEKAHQVIIDDLKKEMDVLKKSKEKAQSQEKRWRKLLQQNNIPLNQEPQNEMPTLL